MGARTLSEVGFYHLVSSPLERALPRLLEKVLASGHRAVLLAGSEERVEYLNGLLWTYEQRSWLPHGSFRDGNAEMQPVYLTLAEENPNGADVLLCVDGIQANFVDRFDRVLDMFDGRSEAGVAAARERWRAYKAAGHALTYWLQTDSGGWERKQ